MAGLSARPSVLFVCLGNICRSPLAEGALRAAAAEAGLAIDVDSAGTGSWHIGEPPDTRAQAEARRNGVAIDHLRGRQVGRDDFYRFTHMIALDMQNRRDLELLAPPDATAELSMLLDWVPGREGQAVADPYFGGDEGFAVTWKDVNEAARALVAALS